MLVQGSTKELIFDTALSMFSKIGYDAVSIRDIAAGVGIKGASIYNHYDSKQEILEHIYEYFRRHMFYGKTSDAKIKELVRTGTLEKLVDALGPVNYSHLEEKLQWRIAAISKIIYSRMLSSDHVAAELYHLNVTGGLASVKMAADYGIELGRFRPFDTDGFANGFAAMYTYMALQEFTGLTPYEPRDAVQGELQINLWITRLLELVEQSDYWERSESHK